MIECYFSKCKFHSRNYDDIGPLCEEENCRATTAEIKQWSEERKQYLQNINATFRSIE